MQEMVDWEMYFTFLENGAKPIPTTHHEDDLS